MKLNYVIITEEKDQSRVDYYNVKIGAKNKKYQKKVERFKEKLIEALKELEKQKGEA